VIKLTIIRKKSIYLMPRDTIAMTRKTGHVLRPSPAARHPHACAGMVLEYNELMLAKVQGDGQSAKSG
jgi:hypothetical protein